MQQLLIIISPTFQTSNFLLSKTTQGVVDIGYSASAPMKFYSQEIGSQFDYYHVITKSAERSVKECPTAVRNSVKALHKLKTVHEVTETLGICDPLPDYLSGGNLELLLEEIDMIIMYTFANLVS